MAFPDKPIEQITFEEIRALIPDQVRESRRLDYKSELPGETKDDKLEFVRDITAFANASGGLVIYGVTDVDGLPQEIVGLAGVDLDAAQRRLQSLANDRVEPRLSSLVFRPIEGDGLRLLLVQIGRSWVRPHAVVDGDRLEFWARYGTQKQRMERAEIGEAFLSSASFVDKIRALRDERLAAITRGEPLYLVKRDRLILHIIPFTAVESGASYDIPSLVSKLQRLQLLSGSANHSRFVFGGYLRSAQGGTPPSIEEYTVFFRNGVLEAVMQNLLISPPSGSDITASLIPGQTFDTNVINTVRNYLAFFRDVDAAPPAKLYLRLEGVGGAFIAGHPRHNRGARLITVDALDQGLETVIESWDVDAAALMKPLLDEVWRASGLPGSPYFAPDGTFDPAGMRRF